LTGDLYVDGTQTYVNSTAILTGDKVLALATASTTALLAASSGIEIGTTSTPYASFLFDGTTNWVVSGSAATGLKAANITDTGLSANQVTYAGTGGLLSGSNNLTWNGSIFTVTGTLSVVGTVSIAQATPINFANGQYIKDNGSSGLVEYSGSAFNINAIGGITMSPTSTSYNQQQGALLSINGGAYINGAVTATTFIGNLTGTATTASNISGFSAGQLLFQYNTGITTATSSLTYTLAVSQLSTPNLIITNITTASGQLFVNSLLSSTSTTTGALTVAGGVGIGGSLYVGGITTITNTLNFSGSLGVGSTSSYGISGQYLQSQGSGSPPLWSTVTVSAINLTQLSSSSTPQYMVFANTSTGLATLEANGPSGLVYIPTGNKFGIGTSTPADTDVYGGGNILDVNGPIYSRQSGSTNRMSFGTSGGTSYIDVTNALGGLQTQISGGTVINLDINGNLQISANWTSPQQGAKLSVQGGGYFSTIVTATTFVGAFSGGVSQVQTQATATNASYYPTFVSANNSSPAAQSLYTTSSFIINPSTDVVGIGTTNPQNKLVVSNSGAVGLEIAPAGGYTGINGVDFLSYNRATSLYAPIGFVTNSSNNSIVILTNGNIGIGTTTPAFGAGSGIQIVNSTRANLGLSFTGSDGYEIFYGGSNNLFIDNIGGSGGNIQFRNIATRSESMRITSAGYVGIGSTNPQGPLVVSAGGAAGVEFFTSGSAVGSGPYFNSYNRSTAQYISWSNYALSHTWFVGTSGATRALDINSTGQVGIGTSTNTTYTLQVNGSFAATTKSFVIDHPTKEGMQLCYGSLESPYHGIRLTGENMLTNGVCVVKLPDYVHGLCKQQGAQVQITNIQHSKVLWVENIDVDKDEFTVRCKQGFFDRKEYKFYWSFTGIRKDIDDLKVEF
jgi:hypothetical protein